ncbi:dephospho-CoA kinase [Baia soyae]|uniref:Dephospho-CoA kinase n=1 Tax=Baia soyae TaxID=1544746 RepID=A0A4R2RZG3_9BACL|nr:dephospho-CoA kinase [Baia soyae]TCP69043.1 dephospho-CoA kinase [Baia soyae]
MVIGLTGGIATGKSTVSKMFQERGAKIIDADQIARLVVEPETEGLQQVIATFGVEVLDSKGQLNRRALGDIIFHDPHARQRLNAILHPLIRAEMKRQTAEFQSEDTEEVIIWDVPLLFESGLTQLVEKVIVVYIPEALQIVRLMERDQLTELEAKARLHAQLSIEEKKKMADFVIDNSHLVFHTERQVDKLWNYLALKNG